MTKKVIVISNEERNLVSCSDLSSFQSSRWHKRIVVISTSREISEISPHFIRRDDTKESLSFRPAEKSQRSLLISFVEMTQNNCHFDQQRNLWDLSSFQSSRWHKRIVVISTRGRNLRDLSSFHSSRWHKNNCHFDQQRNLWDHSLFHSWRWQKRI